jgi:hypothetical protein
MGSRNCSPGADVVRDPVSSSPRSALDVHLPAYCDEETSVVAVVAAPVVARIFSHSRGLFLMRPATAHGAACETSQEPWRPIARHSGTMLALQGSRR